ncbi:MAG: hypothetical protein M1423_01225, partial [Acidobacteria bacterium]|nr:hypothetical protein [Acidobacteriota bacterium]
VERPSRANFRVGYLRGIRSVRSFVRSSGLLVFVSAIRTREALLRSVQTLDFTMVMKSCAGIWAATRANREDEEDC